jgi:hypothetical protein
MIPPAAPARPGQICARPPAGIGAGQGCAGAVQPAAM